ncbi:MAG: hypothetical protein ACTSYH_00670 [Candidatus Heimdallarchaeaceae archaeon]
MGIRSHFLPSNALQGEEIPSFILWNDLVFDQIEIEKSSCCNLVEIHNVDEDSIEHYDSKIIIKNVEVDGYLGLLFKSERTDALLVEAHLTYNFIKDGQKIEAIENTISLFKPQLEIIHIPEVIHVKNGVISEDEKIVLANIGEGTCKIKFNTGDNSDITISHPKRIKEFLDGFTLSFDEGVDSIRNKYENYDEAFSILKWLIHTMFDPGNEELLKEIEEKTETLDDIFESDEKFFRDVIRVYAAAIMKNMSIITAFEQFLDYLKSMAKNRVMLINALDSISVSPKGEYLELVISYTDLLNTKIPNIELDPIQIISDTEIDLSLFSLFSWNGADS